jgi:AcrR family transcriptional regulator
VTETVTPDWRQRPKGDKRERTRGALVQAATELVREKGYERTTLEDVARRAGMTRGAIYGNFRDKEELFLAVAETRWAPIVPDIWPSVTFAEYMRLLAEAVVAAMPARRAAAVGFTSFQTFALTHETLRAGVVDQIDEIYRWSAEGLTSLFPNDELPMPAAIFVRVVHAMMEGLTYQRYFVPELVTDDVIYAAFDALTRRTA